MLRKQTKHERLTTINKYTKKVWQTNTSLAQKEQIRTNSSVLYLCLSTVMKTAGTYFEAFCGQLHSMCLGMSDN